MNTFNRFNPPTFVNNSPQDSGAQDERRRSNDIHGLGGMAGSGMSQRHPAFQSQQQTETRRTSQSQEGNTNSNVTMQFTAATDSLDASLQQAMVDYENAQNGGSLSQFAFNPSLGQGINNMTGQFNEPGPQIPSQTGGSGGPLSINTQYGSMMNYNGLPGSNLGYQTPYDLNMHNDFMLSTSDMTMDLGLMNDEEIAAMNDMFSAQQFGSPQFTSPMGSTFEGTIYGQSLNESTRNIAMTPMSTMPTSDGKASFHSKQPQMSGDTINEPLERDNQETDRAEIQKPIKDTAVTSSGVRKTKTQTASETIGGIKLPWTTPADGWPSTMQGKRPHMYTSYRDAYAPSGFDLMDTLVRVKSRPNKQIEIGAVDLSCSFVVCDAKTHDNPIIYCSESFERMTGYSRFEIKGQNCRFLQSPTGKVEAGLPRKYCDDESVLYLKNCVTSRTEAQISLINYRKGGQPFMNLLTMIPIMDDDGEILQFVGFQVDLVENPHAVSGRNEDGSFKIDYSRNQSLPAYQLQPRDPVTIMEHGQSISKDEVSTLLSTLATPENELSKRMIDKMILENSDDVIHVLSLKGLFLYLSPSCGRVLEYDPTQLVGMALSSICHPSDIVPVTRELKETQSGASVTVVYRIRRKESGYIWFESHGCLHTEQGKGRKCIILVGRPRPVYTLSKQILNTAGGIGEHEMWSKMSTTGMFLYVSDQVKGLLDQHSDELVGTSIQAIMRPDSKAEFNRMLTIVLTGENAELRHEVINRRGQVLQAHTWLYPGDAAPGHKPTFVVAQTRLIKYHRAASRTTSQRDFGGEGSVATTHSNLASQPVTTQTSTPQTNVSSVKFEKRRMPVVVSRAGTLATPLGEQNESLASIDNAFEELKTTRSSSWQYELRQLERQNRVLAEEVQQLLASKKKRKRRRGAGMMQKDCANCHTTSTPEWRRGPSGNRDLCNSCGLRWAKQQGRVSPRTASPRHSASNDSKGDSGTPQRISENSRPSKHTGSLNREESANSTNSKASSTNTTATAQSIPDKRPNPEGGATDPMPPKAARTSGSNLPSRIEEEEEPSESQDD